MNLIYNAIDWLSVKFTVGSIALAVITWNGFIAGLSVLTLLSTLIYNLIKIYKEVKRNKDVTKN